MIVPSYNYNQHLRVAKTQTERTSVSEKDRKQGLTPGDFSRVVDRRNVAENKKDRLIDPTIKEVVFAISANEFLSGLIDNNRQRRGEEVKSDNSDVVAYLYNMSRILGVDVSPVLKWVEDPRHRDRIVRKISVEDYAKLYGQRQAIQYNLHNPTVNSQDDATFGWEKFTTEFLEQLNAHRKFWHGLTTKEQEVEK